MRPFRPSLSNQIQSQGGNNPLLQQGFLGNPHQNTVNFNHHSQISPLLHGLNPPFHHTLPINLHGNHTGMPMAQNNHLGALPQLGQFFLQDPTTQNLNQALALQLQNFPQFQGQLNLLQTANLAAQLQQGGLSWAHNPIQNFNQIMGLVNGQLGSQNPMLQGSQFMPFQCPQNSTSSMQIGSLNLPPSSHPLMAYASSPNSGFVGNPHLTQNNLNSRSSNPTVSIRAMHCKTQDSHVNNTANTMGQHVMIGTPAATKMQTHWNGKNFQPSELQHPQVKHVEVLRSEISNVISDNSASRNLTRNFHRFAKSEPSHNRPLPVNYSENEIRQWREARKKNFATRAKKEKFGSGISSEDIDADAKLWRQQLREVLAKQEELGVKVAEIPTSLLQDLMSADIKGDKRRLLQVFRPLPVNYSKKQIRQWREARKKNFPTRAKKEKFGSGISSEGIDADAKLWRQQLREVLAKQKELGVKAAEIPPSYLSEPADEALKKVNERKAMGADGRFPNKGNNKRGRHGQDNSHAKRPKVRKEAPNPCPSIVKREPSLLQDLMSADIKGDKRRLLHSDQKDPSAADEVESGSSEGESDSTSDNEEVADQHPKGKGKG